MGVSNGAKDNRGKPPTEGTEFWMKQDWENEEQYHKFAAFRDLGPPRTLRNAASKWYNREDTGATLGQYKYFQQLSYLNQWVDRARAYDRHEERQRLHIMEQRRIEAAENHWRLGRMAENLCAGKLQSLARGAPEEIPNSMLVPLLQYSTQLIRMVVGEPAALLAELEKDGDGNEQQLPDFSNLTDDEIDQMNALADKLYGRE